MNKTLVSYVESHFIDNFKTKPLLVFAPGRINLIGEHTDYNDGFVFPAAIDKGIVAALQKSDLDTCSIIALDVNERYDFSLENIASLKNVTWRNYVVGVVDELQKNGAIVTPFNLVFAGDIPSGAGLSSSAALENSVVFGLNSLFELDMSKKDMIFISQKAEHNYVGVKCGIMDQYISMFGKKNSAVFLDCKSLEAKTVELHLQDYSLLLINTHVKHSLAESAYNQRRAVCKNIAKLLDVDSLRFATEELLRTIKNQLSEEDYQKALYVIQENIRVNDAFNAVKNNDISTLGTLLFASHNGLKEQYKVSCNELDFLVDYAKSKSEIIGARMMGGGFGGCTISIIKKDTLKRYKQEITQVFKEKFNTDCSFYTVNISNGTRIIKA